MSTQRVEEIVCDTSFVSVVQSAHKPGSKAAMARWPEEKTERLERAILGISVISLAELRSGYRADGWGPDRIERAEAIARAYVWFPLDMDVVDHCAKLRAESKSQAWNLSDNDLWIAATALSRNCPLATTDLDFCRIEGLDLIYLPANVDAPAECP